MSTNKKKKQSKKLTEPQNKTPEPESPEFKDRRRLGQKLLQENLRHSPVPMPDPLKRVNPSLQELFKQDDSLVLSPEENLLERQFNLSKKALPLRKNSSSPAAKEPASATPA